MTVFFGATGGVESKTTLPVYVLAALSVAALFYLISNADTLGETSSRVSISSTTTGIAGALALSPPQTTARTSSRPGTATFIHDPVSLLTLQTPPPNINGYTKAAKWKFRRLRDVPTTDFGVIEGNGNADKTVPRLKAIKAG